MEDNREKAKRLRRVKIQRRALLLIISKKKQERMEVSEWLVRTIMDSCEACWKTPTKEMVVESDNLSWSVAVGHGVGKGEWEKSGIIDAKNHRVSWSLSVTIQTAQEARLQEREKVSQELQDWPVENLEDEAAKTFDRGEEEYEHMLMDLQELSLGVIHIEEGECVRRSPTPPTASLLFSPGEENAAHQNLDSLLELREKDSRTQSAIMDWDDAGVAGGRGT